MAMGKRIFLFLAVNILIMLTLSITTQLLGIQGWLNNNYGINYGNLLAFCAVFGFGGAFISLLLSRFMAKMFMGVKVIDPRNPGSEQARALVQTVHRLAQKAGLPAMPEVGYYESPEVNAFATGPSKSKALVAVSSGLVNRMDNAAVEGVLGHEIAHIANGDMVTMTLLQGIVNTFVMFFARIAAWGVSQAIAGDREERGGGASFMVQFVCVIVFEILFSILGSIVVSYYSRVREFRADKGGAQLAGKDKMIHALQSLKTSLNQELVDDSQPALATLKINGKRGGLMALLASHPDLDKRIERLRTSVG